MITKRIIPCLDVKDGKVVKGVNFTGLKEISEPMELGKYYSEAGADELVFYDITASVEGRKLFVDILTKVALEASGWERGRVIGSGTVLDTARFRYVLSKECGVDARNIHGYILGEHGDSEFAAWSMTTIAGRRIDDYCSSGSCVSGIHFDKEKIIEEVRHSAYHIIDYKGSTYFAVGLALTRIAGAILRSEHSILSVSMTLNGEFGLHDVCLSVPCVVGRNGAERIIEGVLPEDELSALAASGKRLHEALTSIRQ